MSASLDDVKDFDFVISEAFRIDVGLDSPNLESFIIKSTIEILVQSE